jgi:hypothetical protein
MATSVSIALAVSDGDETVGPGLAVLTLTEDDLLRLGRELDQVAALKAADDAIFEVARWDDSPWWVQDWELTGQLGVGAYGPGGWALLTADQPASGSRGSCGARCTS